jgi:hypothetical protein
MVAAVVVVVAAAAADQNLPEHNWQHLNLLHLEYFPALHVLNQCSQTFLELPEKITDWLQSRNCLLTWRQQHEGFVSGGEKLATVLEQHVG